MSSNILDRESKSDVDADAGGRRVLAVVDMQRVFSDATSPWAVAEYGTIRALVGRLCQAYGSSRVYYTRFLPPTRIDGCWRPYYERWSFASREDTVLWDFDLPDSVSGHLRTTEAEAMLITSHTMSKWTDNLAGRVDGEDTLTLCGVSTDCCVLATAIAAADAGRSVRVVSDACAAPSPTAHNEALSVLRRMDPRILVTTFADEILSLQRR